MRENVTERQLEGVPEGAPLHDSGAVGEGVMEVLGAGVRVAEPQSLAVGDADAQAEGVPVAESRGDSVSAGETDCAGVAEGVFDVEALPLPLLLAESVTEAVSEGTPGVFTVHTSSSTAR